MRTGGSRIIFPLDVAGEPEARQWVARLQDHVGMFKVGLELFIRSGASMVRWITEEAGAEVFLDLKLHDIPATVQRAMQVVADLKVSLATVHCGENPSMLEAAVKGGAGRVRILGVTVLTSVSEENLRASGYAEEMLRPMQRLVLHKADMAQAAGLAGIVCSGREAAAVKERFGSGFLAVTPGIRPDWGQQRKDDQQRIVTPAMAIRDGADYLVIGRPIRDAADPVGTADRIADEIDAALASRRI